MRPRVLVWGDDPTQYTNDVLVLAFVINPPRCYVWCEMWARVRVCSSNGMYFCAALSNCGEKLQVVTNFPSAS